MALRSVVTDNSADQSIWFDYKNSDDEVLARFKVNPIGIKQYQLSLGVAISADKKEPLTIDSITKDTKYDHEPIIEAVARHLLTDWENVELSFDKGLTYSIVEYSPENALNLMLNGDLGTEISNFVIDKAKSLQEDADKEKLERLGKSLNSTSIKQAESSTKSPKRIVKNNNSKSLE